MIPRPLILVPGTHGIEATAGDQAEWFWPHRPFWTTAAAQGLVLLGEHDPFQWSTAVGGLWRRSLVEWKAGADALRWYGQLKVIQAALWAQLEIPEPQVVSVVAHSHGGNLAALAAARNVRGFRIDTLVLVATPIRDDLAVIYAGAARRVRRLISLETGPRDLWRELGLLGSAPGHLPETAEVIPRPDADHHDLLEPTRWTREGWWQSLLEAPPAGVPPDPTPAH